MIITEDKEVNYTYRIYPNGKQQRQLAGYFGSARALYNTCLWLNRERYEGYIDGVDDMGYIGRFDMIAHISALEDNPRYPWLKDFPSEFRGMIYQDADIAFSKFLEGLTDYPEYKDRVLCDKRFSFYAVPDDELFKHPVTKADNAIKIPGMDPIKIHLKKPYMGELESIHIEYKSDKYTAVLTCRVTEDTPKPPKDISEVTEKPVDIDKSLLELSIIADEDIFNNPSEIKKCKDMLADLQKKLSRKTKGSNAYRKLKADMKKIHVKMARIRNYRLHRVSEWIVDNYDLICSEDLDISKLMNDPDATLNKLVEYMNHKPKGKRIRTRRSRRGGKRGKDAKEAKKALEAVSGYIETLGTDDNGDVKFSTKR